MIEKLKEYAAIGTPNIWVIDPGTKRMFKYESSALSEVEGDIIATTDPHLELTRSEIFVNR